MVSFRQSIFFVCVVAALAVMVFANSEESALVGKEYPEVSAVADGVRSFDELASRFELIADKKDALYAFEILRRAELPPNTDLHLLGHVVGDELYKQKGLDGIRGCTHEFRNACSHSIVIGTLNEFGAGGLPAIREACKQAPGGSGAYTMCFHGLGHGVFSFYQFEFPETVAFCEKTGTPEYFNREYIECVGGAVMELMGGGGHDPYNWEIAREKYLAEKSPLSLCLGNNIPEEAKEICLIYLTPHIWDSVGINLGRPDPSLFSKAFAVCNTISHTKQHLRDACFGGFGKEFVPLVAGRDIRELEDVPPHLLATAAGWCAYAPTQDGREACIRDAAASAFWGGENDPDLSFTFCSVVEKEMQRACYQSLAENIMQYVTTPKEQTALCDRIHNEYERDICSNL